MCVCVCARARARLHVVHTLMSAVKCRLPRQHVPLETELCVAVDSVYALARTEHERATQKQLRASSPLPQPRLEASDAAGETETDRDGASERLRVEFILLAGAASQNLKDIPSCRTRSHLPGQISNGFENRTGMCMNTLQCSGRGPWRGQTALWRVCRTVLLPTKQRAM